MLDNICQDFDFSDGKIYNPDTLMKNLVIDRQIATYYASKLLQPIKYGENGVFFWFRGSGMTTAVRDVFSSKAFLTNNLQGLSERLKIIQLWGHTPDKKTLEGVLKDAGYDAYQDLKLFCENALKRGLEVVCVLGRVDDFSIREQLRIFKMLLRLNAINYRRVHVIFNFHNKPQFERILQKNPELIILCSRMEIMPLIDGNLLKKYVQTRAKNYDFAISESDLEKVTRTYGGILQLTKEYLRSKGELPILELKLRTIWNSLPKEYKDELNNQILQTSQSSSISKDLQDFGVANLKLFELHQSVLNFDPGKALPKVLTHEEMQLWNYLNEHKGAVVDKDKIISILRPIKSEDLTLWALDQAMSRYRKKLAKVGFDPQNLRTIKGKGYVWS